MDTSRTCSTGAMASGEGPAARLAARANWRGVVLIGFMGSGKSTVGELLAERLGWRFIDTDREIERLAGMSVEDIFRASGEPAFRETEERLVRDFLDHAATVVAPGGGWAATPGRIEALGPDTLSVWLRVDAATALSRLSGTREVRPLLQVADPLGRAEALLADREPHYALAGLHLDSASASPAALVDAILEHLVARADAPSRPVAERRAWPNASS